MSIDLMGAKITGMPFFIAAKNGRSAAQGRCVATRSSDTDKEILSTKEPDVGGLYYV